MTDLGKSSTGLQPNVAALLAYVVGIVTGIVFLLIEKESPFVKFHAWQCIGLSLTSFVLNFVFAFIPVLNLLFSLVVLALWIVMMLKAYQGAWFKLPLIGDFAAKQAGVAS